MGLRHRKLTSRWNEKELALKNEHNYVSWKELQQNIQATNSEQANKRENTKKRKKKMKENI